MDISLFDYNLPEDRIAHAPAEPRDSCKLLVYNREKQNINEEIFRDITKYFQSGDVLVLNNTKVFPARLFGQKKETGGKVEVFMVRQESLQENSSQWKVMIRGKVSTENTIIFENSDLEIRPLEKIDDVSWLVSVSKWGSELYETLDEIGKAPLPPYIKNDEAEVKIREEYQTVFSQHEGSVAAPTAGLHFTDELLEQLTQIGVQIEYVTLHVGLGTFAPVRVDDITQHHMHAEFTQVDAEVIQRIVTAKHEGRRVIGVGTTSVRVLEGIVAQNLEKKLSEIEDYYNDINIFIFPGYEFKVLDGLITNFHLPKSTLIMLVSALMGREEILRVYEHAIEQKYRFYSFGDAMLIV